MNESEKGLKVARELASWLRERFGERIVEIRVFGSVARGEADEDSDIDMLILFTSMPSREERDEISRRSYDLDLEHETVTQCIIQSTDRWESPMIRGSLLRAVVDEEGVRV